MLVARSKKARLAAAVAAVLFLMLLFSGGPEQIMRKTLGAAPGVTVEGYPVGGMLRNEVAQHVRDLSREIEKAPRNAYLDPRTDTVVPEVPGCKVDVEATVDRIMRAPAGEMVLLDRLQLDPEITANLYSSIITPVGRYHTYYGGGGDGRCINIELATSFINNSLVYPGEIFSYNKAVGPCTFERGFQLAPVIVGNAVVPGLGGGLCQVSSTLYNAVLDAGLEVVERHPHSLPVTYVPPGRDATVSTTLDFKFRNSTDYFILVKGACYGGIIEIRLYSSAPAEQQTEGGL